MKSPRAVRSAVSILIVLLSSMPFYEADAISMRCGVRLITEGDTRSKVLAECGEPDHVETWQEERIYRYYYYGSAEDDGYPYDYLKPRYIKEYILIEEWTYNHGRHRFMDHILFENGRVRRIESGDYGY